MSIPIEKNGSVFYFFKEVTEMSISKVIFLLIFYRDKKWTSQAEATATIKMECLVIIVNAFQPLTIITKRSILDMLQ